MRLRVGLTTILLAATTAAYCQEVPPPSQGRGQGRHDQRGGDRGPEGRGPEGREGRSPQLLPPGTWWRDPKVIKDLGLTDAQRKKMDEVFLQARVQLVHMHASLEEEELLLEPLLNAEPVDQGKALAQISKIADTRADLEKTNAKMLLSIRAVLSQDQWQKLRASGPGAAGLGHPGAPGVGGAPRGKIGWAGRAFAAVMRFLNTCSHNPSQRPRIPRGICLWGRNAAKCLSKAAVIEKRC